MADPEDGQDVLGSLPRRRPGIKSPRRAGAKAAAEQRAAAPPPPSQPRAGEAQAGGQQPGDLERLARAGIGIAGGATAVGLKLAGRAIGGLGRAVGRR